ncbi:MAG: hypothetical protein DRQ62_04170 [Gammaproteobacteria bacterium]|nr:MAG: hypothetical protein DRQ62_04170 [Gammaproteobacteria bacterium]
MALKFTQDHKDENKIVPGNFNKSFPYRFRVLDKNSNDADSEHILQINPQELTQDETFSIQIRPTQKGVLVEHQGSVLKDLVIAGTTGFAPFGGVGGVNGQGINRGSSSIRSASDYILGTQSTGKKTGYEEFHVFRNFIRAYHDKKIDPKNSNFYMTFENPKDAEYFIVEPLKFAMKRSISNRMLYDYNITFKILGRIEVIEKELEKGWYRDLQKAMAEASAAIDNGTAIIRQSEEFLRNVSSDFTQTVLEPLESISEAIAATSSLVNTIIDIPRTVISAVESQIRDLRNEVVEASNIDISGYNTLFGRTSTTQFQINTPGYDEYNLNIGLSRAQRGVNIILANNEFFGSKNNQELGENLVTVYDNKISFTDTEYTRPVIIKGNDDIKRLAAREMGDVTKFRELIILNNLRYPYIDTVASEHVLAPGDIILIPLTSDPRLSGLATIESKEYPITQSLTQVERQLGIDLQLTNDFDLAVTNVNDFKLVGGHDNALQTLKIKFALEKGDLLFHPTLGTNLNIGKKFTGSQVFDLKNDLLRTVLSDPRFSDAEFDISFINTTLNIAATVREREFDYVIPISFEITV